MQQLANHVSGGVIANAGHWIADEQPEELAKQIGQFLIH
jgi:pimeloyl-ACP methyl ester carboxylesterase